jgi:hypothetical protein
MGASSQPARDAARRIMAIRLFMTPAYGGEGARAMSAQEQARRHDRKPLGAPIPTGDKPGSRAADLCVAAGKTRKARR